MFRDDGEGQVQLYTTSSAFYKPADFHNEKIKLKKKERNKEMTSLFWSSEITGSELKEVPPLLLDNL